jgi:hypothetical protein
MAGETNDALNRIVDNQYSLIKEFKSGFGKLRGEGVSGLVKMLLIGIPAFLAGLTIGIVGEIKKFIGLITGRFIPFLKSLKSVQLIFAKIGSALKGIKATKFFTSVQTIATKVLTSVQTIVTNIVGKVTSLFKALKATRFFRSARILFSRKGFIGRFFIGIVKNFKGIFSSASAFIKGGGAISNMFGNLAKYAQFAFKLGGRFAKLLGPIGIAITVITGLIGGIKGAFKGFKEDGIVGMLREGIIGVFNALIGGLVKMVGSLIGGIFKLLGFEKIGETIKSGFSDFIDGIVGAFRGLANFVGGLFTLNFGMLKEGIGQMLDGIINILLGIVKGIGGIIIGALAGIVKAAYAILVKLPIAIIKFMAKAWKFIYFDLPILAFKLIFKALKFLLIDLPIKLIKFMAKAWKFIYFDLPIMAFKLIFKALKFILLDIPLKLVGFAATLLKAIFFDLPLMALKLVFDGLKFLFIGLPGMLIDKAKNFFSNMVSSIGDAFSGAFDFVKRIGKASFAALKAALPGGESPKEAFMRVMGEGKGGEEKEEGENKEKIKKSAEKDVEADEQFIPQIKPKQKESDVDFEARMMATINGDTPSMAMDTIGTGGQSFSSEGLSSDDGEAAPTGEGSTLIDKLNGIKDMMLGIISAPFTLLKTIHSTIFGVVRSVIEGVMGLVGTILGFIGKLGKAGIAAVKAIMPGGDSPAEAFMKVLTDEGEPKKGGMTPVLSSETPEEKSLSERDQLANKFEDVFLTGGASEREVVSDVNGVFTSDSVILTGAQGDEYDQLGKGMDMKEQSKLQADYRENIRNTTDQEGLRELRTKGGEAFNERVDERKAAKADKKPESLESAFAYAESAAGLLDPKEASRRVAAAGPAASIAAGPEEAKAPKKLSFMDVIKKAGNFAKKAASFTPPGMLIKGVSKVGGLAKDAGGGFFEKIREAKEQKRIAQKEKFRKFFGGGDNRGGSELTMGQKENAELKGENQGGGGAIIAPSSSVNNSKSSVTNTTIAAPPHIDRTQNLFGNTVLDW